MQTYYLIYALKITHNLVKYNSNRVNFRERLQMLYKSMVDYIKTSIPLLAKEKYFRDHYLICEKPLRILRAMNEPLKFCVLKKIVIAIEIKQLQNANNVNFKQLKQAKIINVYYSEQGYFTNFYSKSDKLLFSSKQIEARNLYCKAMQLSKQKQFNQAIKIYLQLPILDYAFRHDLKYLQRLARAYEKNKNFIKAIKTYSQIITIEHTCIWARAHRGLIAYDSKHNYDLALQDFNYVLLHAKSTHLTSALLIELHYRRGKIYHSKDKLWLALCDYKFVLQHKIIQTSLDKKVKFKLIYEDTVRHNNLILKTIFAGNLIIGAQKQYTLFNANHLAIQLKKRKNFGFHNAEAMLKTIGKQTTLVIEAISNGKVDLYKTNQNGQTFIKLALQYGYYDLATYAIQYKYMQANKSHKKKCIIL
jgi:tetratricopeptide (TPR) repeat protein